jgi:predicted NBD/HSP70 family sugar kinase
MPAIPPTGAASGVAVGVDIGGTRLRVLVQHRDGLRSEPLEVPVPSTVRDLVAAAAGLVRRITDDDVARVAVGLPGRTGERVVAWMPNLRFLDGVPLSDELEAALGGRCALLNDAQAALLAEHGEGAAAGRSSAVLVSIGTGIGGAVMVDGRLVRGATGTAGSFGWLPMARSAPDPDHGDWEQVASGTALATAGAPWGGADELVTAARRGDAAAVAAAAGIGELLGRGTAGLASVFDPEVVVLAGGVCAALDVLEPALRAAHQAHASPTGRLVPIVTAQLGPRAGLVGALQAALTAEEPA